MLVTHKSDFAKQWIAGLMGVLMAQDIVPSESKYPAPCQQRSSIGVNQSGKRNFTARFTVHSGDTASSAKLYS